MTGAPWTLAIDFGTTTSVAVTAAGGRVRFVRPDGARAMPSAVFMESIGTLSVGPAAQQKEAVAPHRFTPAPRRLLGRPDIVLGDALVPATAPSVAVLRRVYDEACDQVGWRPAVVRLAYPAGWSPDGARLAALTEAVHTLELPNLTFVLEPVAAAAHICARFGIEPGRQFAIYDLGGGTVDCAVLTRAETGFTFAAAPGGLDRLGGSDLDDRLAHHLAATRLPDPVRHALAEDTDRRWRAHRQDFHDQVRRAREALSTAATCEIRVPAAGIEVVLTRAELDEVLREDVAAGVAELSTTIAAAGSPDELDGIFLIGGASRMPLVAATVAQVTGLTPRQVDDPEAAVALGAVVNTLTVDRPVRVPGVDPPGALRRLNPTPKVHEEHREKLYWDSPGSFGLVLLLAAVVIILGRQVLG